MDFTSISWFAVALAAVGFFALGGLWFGALFGKVWMREVGMTEEDAASSNMALIFGATFVLEVIAAIGLAAIIGTGATPVTGMGIGVAVGALIVVSSIGVLALYERRSVMLTALNGGYNLIGFALMGAIVGWFQ